MDLPVSKKKNNKNIMKDRKKKVDKLIIHPYNIYISVARWK